MAENWVIQEHRSESYWLDLPPEMVTLISFSRDFRTFKFPPSFDFNSPCLMFPQTGTTSWRIFHSLYNKFYDFDFPELDGAEIHYSRDGWLLMSRDEGSLFFFNPFTNVKLELPPTPSSFISVFCFTSPPTSSDCCVFGIVDDSCHLPELEYGFINFGDHEWKLGQWEYDHRFWPSYCPPLFHNGVYYLLDGRATSIKKFDPAKEEQHQWEHIEILRETNEENRSRLNNETNEEEEEEGNGQERLNNEINEDEEEDNDDEEDEEEDDFIVDESYMVEVDGDIWTIFVKNNTAHVSVKRLDLLEKQWKKLYSLGDRCLYLSNKGSFAEACMGSDMANKIYFDRFYDQSGVMYCMSTRMYYSVDGSFASKGVAGNTTTGNEVYGHGLAQPYNAAWIKPTYRG